MTTISRLKNDFSAGCVPSCTCGPTTYILERFSLFTSYFCTVPIIYTSAYPTIDIFKGANIVDRFANRHTTYKTDTEGNLIIRAFMKLV